MSLKRTALSPFFDYAESLYQGYKRHQQTNIILYYTGDLNFGFVNTVSSKLEKLLELELSDKQAQKRFFSVFVEAIQNIRLHGCPAEDDKVHASMLVYLTGEKLCAKMLNVVSKAQSKMLARRYTEANQLKRADLKAKYLETMQNGVISSKGGAGLGIITIVLRSQNPSHFKMIPIDNGYDIFESEICVNVS